MIRVLSILLALATSSAAQKRPTFGQIFPSETANQCLCGPSSGSAASPAFRLFSPSDLPGAVIDPAREYVPPGVTSPPDLSSYVRQFGRFDGQTIYGSPNPGRGLTLLGNPSGNGTVVCGDVGGTTTLRGLVGIAPITGGILSSLYVGGTNTGTDGAMFVLNGIQAADTSGNGSVGQRLLHTSGAIGQRTTDSTGAFTAGGGADIAFATGNGGDAPNGGSTGTGGDFSAIAGNGGAAPSNANLNTYGRGGQVTITAGQGGAVNSGANGVTSGGGGAVAITAGSGGANVTGNTNGNGGSVTIQAGVKGVGGSGGQNGQLFLKTNGANQLTIGSTGLVAIASTVNSYNGVNTAEHGVPATVGSASQGPKSTGATTFNALASTIASDAFYNLWFYAEETAAGSGGTCSTAASVVLNLRWTGPDSQQQNTAAVTLSLPAALATGTQPTGSASQNVLVRAKASTALVVVEGTFTNGNCSTQPTYTIWGGATAL